MIVDLPELLALSSRVLPKAVPEHFHKVRFIDAADVASWRGLEAYLTINIDSFQEMPPATIAAYMSDLVTHGRYFYVKNPVAKYDPRSIGVAGGDERKFNDLFSLGYCRDIIDIFDDEALARARRKYLDVYRPTSSWSLVADQPMAMFPYLHHALYRAG